MIYTDGKRTVAHRPPASTQSVTPADKPHESTWYKIDVGADGALKLEPLSEEVSDFLNRITR